MNAPLTYDNRPIFIVGLGRSGTTLMSSLLSAHPNITIPTSETKFLTQWMKTDSPLENFRDFKVFWEEYSQSERFSYLGIDPDAALDRILIQDRYDYKTIFTSILQEYARKMQKKRWGEKTPQNSRYIQLLFEWYPQARILWMLRDPRAAVASHLSAPWSKDTRTHASEWNYNVCLFEQWQDDKRVLLVKYEALVLEPEHQLKRICHFLNEDYTPAMITDRSEMTSPPINRTGWALEHTNTVLQPVNTRSIEKWHSILSSDQIVIVELITRGKMLTYGYKPIMSSLHYNTTRLFAKAKDKISQIKSSTCNLNKI